MPRTLCSLPIVLAIILSQNAVANERGSCVSLVAMEEDVVALRSSCGKADIEVTIHSISGQWTLKTSDVVLDGDLTGKRTLMVPFFSEEPATFWKRLGHLPEGQRFFSDLRLSLRDAVTSDLAVTSRLFAALLGTSAGEHTDVKTLPKRVSTGLGAVSFSAESSVTPATFYDNCDRCLEYCDSALDRCLGNCQTQECRDHCYDRYFDCIIACFQGPCRVP